MGLEVYYPQDIRNALLAAEQAVNAMADAANSDQVDASPNSFTAGFLVGYRAALTTLALAFGLVRLEEGADYGKLARHADGNRQGAKR